MEFFQNILNLQDYIDIAGYILSLVFAFIAQYYRTSSRVQSLISAAVDKQEKEFHGLADRGKTKLEHAVLELYQHVPVFLRPLLTKERLADMLQPVFDSMKSFATKQLDGAVEKAEIILYGSQEARE